MEGIIEMTKNLGSLETFVSLVQKAGLTETLDTEGPFTVFAPNDEAFSELPPETLETLGRDADALAEVLNYHLVTGEFTLDDLGSVPSLETVQGESLLVDSLDDTYSVNDAAIIKPDVSYLGGLIQVIDAVLLP